MKRSRVLMLTVALVALLFTLTSCASDADEAGHSLQHAMDRLVSKPDGPPGAFAVVQSGGYVQLFSAGRGDVATGTPPALTDHMRLASTAKAFSGAVALSLVDRHTLSLTDTVGRRLAGQGLPAAWSAVTLAQALQHTSGIPEYLDSPQFRTEFSQDPSKQFDGPHIWTYVANQPLLFSPGTAYHYSNTDNVIVALMAEAATGEHYDGLLARLVYRPLGLGQTSLPSGTDLPDPFMHGYVPDPPDAPADISEAISASGPWASGGIVSTPADLNAFARGYVGAVLFPHQVQQQQLTWIDGESSYPGPGKNSAGLGVFRYETRCGTVYGHTGNIPGYSQFFAATLDGERSVTVSVNEALSEAVKPEIMQQLRGVDEQAVCAMFES